MSFIVLKKNQLVSLRTINHLNIPIFKNNVFVYPLDECEKMQILQFGKLSINFLHSDYRVSKLVQKNTIGVILSEQIILNYTTTHSTYVSPGIINPIIPYYMDDYKFNEIKKDPLGIVFIMNVGSCFVNLKDIEEINSM